MRKVSFLTFVILSFTFMGISAYAIVPTASKKIYINKENVHVDKNGIAVKTKKGMLKIKTLRSDRRGFYVFEKDCSTIARKGDCDGDLPCAGCGGSHTNEFARDVCEANHMNEPYEPSGR